MDNKDIIDTYYKNKKIINHHWRMSVLINTVFIGWLISIKTSNGDMPEYINIFLLVIYVPAIVFSCAALYREYGTSKKIVDLLDSTNVDSDVEEYLGILSHNCMKEVTIAMHLIYAFIVLSIIWANQLYGVTF